MTVLCDCPHCTRDPDGCGCGHHTRNQAATDAWRKQQATGQTALELNRSTT